MNDGIKMKCDMIIHVTGKPAFYEKYLNLIICNLMGFYRKLESIDWNLAKPVEIFRQILLSTTFLSHIYRKYVN